MRRAQAGGAFATIVHRGDEERGDVLVKVCQERGVARAYAPGFNPEGPLEFERLLAEDADASEAAVDELIAKRREFDRDLWVIEIEDREGRHFLTERVRDPGAKPEI